MPAILSATASLYVSDAVYASLSTTAAQLQDRFPDCTAAQLQQAIVGWLEQSLEQLAEDAAFHLAEGDSAYSFNRQGFERLLERTRER